MNNSNSKQRRWPGIMSRIALVVAIIAILILIMAGPSYRMNLLPLLPALLLTGIGFVLFIPALLFGIIGHVACRRYSLATSRAGLVVIFIAVFATALTIFWATRLNSAPPIHDISTDLENPPVFIDVIPLRQASGAQNQPEYISKQSMGGKELDVSAAQGKAFPDIQPLILEKPPSTVVLLAGQVVKDLGWDLVAMDVDEGRIEATDTTLYFGFKDDIVVRVRPHESGSRVDVRSKSRIGVSDVGANAHRIRTFLDELMELAGSDLRNSL